MTKRILAIVVAVMMVMALSVSVFAAELVSEPISKTTAGQYEEGPIVTLPTPIAKGSTVTITIKGETDSSARFYLSDDNYSTMMEMPSVQYLSEEAGTFEWTGEANTAVGDATCIVFKGINGGATITITSVVIEGYGEVADDAAAPADDVVEDGTEADNNTVEPDTAAPAPAPAPATTETKAPSTGIALAVVPAVVAMAAVAVSKKH